MFEHLNTNYKLIKKMDYFQHFKETVYFTVNQKPIFYIKEKLVLILSILAPHFKPYISDT